MNMFNILVVFSTSVFVFSDSVFPIFGVRSWNPSSLVPPAFLQLPCFSTWSLLQMFAHADSFRVAPLLFFERNVFFLVSWSATMRVTAWCGNYSILVSFTCAWNIAKMDPLLLMICKRHLRVSYQPITDKYVSFYLFYFSCFM